MSPCLVEAEDPRVAIQCALIQLEASAPEAAWETLALPQQEGHSKSALALYRALVLGELERWDEALEQAEVVQGLEPGNQFLDTLYCYLFLGSHRLDAAVARLQLEKPSGWLNWNRPQLAPFPPLLSRLLLQVELNLLPLEYEQLTPRAALEEVPEFEPPAVSWTWNGLVRSVKGYAWQRRGTSYWEKALSNSRPDRRQPLLEKAVEAQRLAVQLEPQQFRSYYYLGEALLYSSTPPGSWKPDFGRLREAEDCFLRSWKQEGVNPYLLFYLGRTLQLLGHPDGAASYLERALEKFQKFPEAHYALGQLHLLMGQKAAAREWLKQSVSSDFLPVARDRLQELHQAWKEGFLEKLPSMPVWSPVPPEGDSGPTEVDLDPGQSSPTANVENPESHQCGDPQNPPQSHETCPDEPGLAVADSPATPEEAEPSSKSHPD